MDNFGVYNNGSLNIDLSNISYTGELVIASIGKAASGTVNSVNNIGPDGAGNVSINADNIPASVTNKYYSDTLVDTHLLNILTTDQDILYRNGTGLSRLPVGATNTYLTTDINSKLSWATKRNVYSKLSELTDCSIATPSNSQFLVYENLFWKNKSITSDNVTQGTSNLYYNDTLVSSYLKSIMTTIGDILYINNSGNLARLPIGASNQYLRVAAGTLQWFSINSAINTYLLSVLTNAGDMLYRDANSNLMRLAIGSDNTHLVASGGIPGWETIGSPSISTLSDVLLTNLQNTQILQYNGAKWINVAVPQTTTSLSALSDCTITTPSTGQFLKYTANNKWENITQSFTALGTLANISTDVAYNNLVNNQMLRYSSLNNKWNNVTFILDYISNVLFTNLQSGEYLKYDGAKWVNSSITTTTTLSALTDCNITTPSNGEYLKYDGAKWVNSAITVPKFATLNDTANDMNISNINSHDILYYFNAKWTNGKPNLGLSNGNVNFGTLANGDFVKYDGAKWINSQITQYSDASVLAYIKTIMSTNGDILIRNSSGDIVRLGIGSANQVLTVNNSLPEWKTPTAATQSLAGLSDVTISNIADYQYIYYDSGTQKYINGKVLDLEKTSQDVVYDTPANNGMCLLRVTGKWRPRNLGLSNLTADVTLSGVASGDCLEHDGNVWKNTRSLANLKDTQITVNPYNNPTVYTLTYNQTNNPIVRSTFYTATPILPLNNNVDATGDVSFLNLPGSKGNISGYYAPWTQAIKANFYKATGWGIYDTKVRTTGDNMQSPQGTFNINFSQNPLQQGTQYSLFGILAFDNGAYPCTAYGLKTQALVNAEMLSFATPPINTGDWDQMVTFTHPGIGVAFRNFTAAAQYFMVKILFATDQWSFVGGAFIGTGAQSQQNIILNAPNDITVTNPSGSLVVTNGNSGKTNEVWNLNLSNAINYFTTTVIHKVIRGVNSLFLNNTQYSDSDIRINNGTNNFKIRNSTGTTDYLTVASTLNTSHVRLVVPNNRACMMYYDGGVSSTVSIAALNTYYLCPLTTTNFWTTGETGFSAAASEMTCSITGTYKIICSAMINLADGQTCILRLGKNSTTFYPGTWFGGECNNIYSTYTCTTIQPVTAGEKIGLYAMKTGGAIPKTLAVLAVSITVSNNFNS